MCLTIPKKIISIKNKKAKVDTGTVDVSIIKNLKAGDWVLVNANLAVQKVSQSEAKKILKLIQS
ncbi:HypC/HybG/HupF family hydrogenase formation chaperone [Patescibacteria group bacterium]|nr:HypC/HybG/HupF family hydrogenase formation chaperone [Patescibacteria group bacterium]MBU1890404.1 HypC/HybG/HupF family hydrogenase formation chaperone [Patescibacteria group bacterium]